uniref:Succinate dehydrogenase assembly factor 3 n=1 Tax=Salmo trutta TaxID=8032 RepID=A0A674DWE2_SALTR
IQNAAHMFIIWSLYKRILIALGDQYVKDEFRRNKMAASKVTVFMGEWGINWQQYIIACHCKCTVFEETGDLTGMGDLKLFQGEQVGQLYDLMLESTKPNRQLDIQGDVFKK